MKTRLILTSEEIRKRAILIVGGLPLDPVHEIEIREKKKDISANQRALYWKWLTIIGLELGETKEELHERYKDRFLTVIYERDDPDYAEMLETLRTVYREGMRDEALSLRRKVITLTSITTATTKQMSELMTDIEHEATSLGISLPHPDDV